MLVLSVLHVVLMCCLLVLHVVCPTIQSKDMSKQNSQRKERKANCRKGEGSSGVTLHVVLAHCRRRRPKITFLENVSEMEQASSFNDVSEVYVYSMSASGLCMSQYVSYAVSVRVSRVHRRGNPKRIG